MDDYYLGLDNRCSDVEHCIYSDGISCLECEDKICKKDMSKSENNIADKKAGQSLIKENNKVEN